MIYIYTQVHKKRGDAPKKERYTNEKMEMIARFYEKNLDLEKKFNEAEKANDEKGMGVCREGYQELLQEVRAEGEDFSSMMRLYSAMKQRGNKLLDVSGSYTEPERIIQMFKEFGVTEFTFSANWTNAMDTAWAFTKWAATLKEWLKFTAITKSS